MLICRLQLEQMEISSLSIKMSMEKLKVEKQNKVNTSIIRFEDLKTHTPVWKCAFWVIVLLKRFN